MGDALACVRMGDRQAQKSKVSNCTSKDKTYLMWHVRVDAVVPAAVSADGWMVVVTVGTVDVKNKKRKKETFSFFVYSPYARTHASRYQRIRVVVAVGTADVKKKERKKKTNLLLTRMGGRQRGWTNGDGSGHPRVQTPTHPRGGGGGHWHCGCQERKKEKPTFCLRRWVVVNADGQRWWW